MTLLPILAYASLSGGKMAPMTFYATIMVAFAIGLLGPDFVLKQMRAAHLKKVERGLPDALDMLVICAQAGLALENAIERVAIDSLPPTRRSARSSRFCASELRIGADRRSALLALGDEPDSIR